MRYILPRITFAKYNLFDNIPPYETTYLPASITTYKRATQYCCPYCGRLHITEFDTPQSLDLRIPKGQLKAVGFCCTSCHTFYYIPKSLIIDGEHVKESVLQYWLPVYKDERNDE